MQFAKLNQHELKGISSNRNTTAPLKEQSEIIREEHISLK